MTSITKVNCESETSLVTTDQYYWLLLEEPTSSRSTSESELDRETQSSSSSSSPIAIVEVVALASCAAVAC